MKALTIDRYGGPEVMQVRDIDVPEPGPQEALIAVSFAGINFMDIHTRQGKYRSSRSYTVRLPCTLGMEGAGEVVRTGPGTTRVRAGDRVAWCISWGSYANYACVPESRLAKLPEGTGLDIAAASIFQGSTAHYLVHDVARLEAGMTCLVHAASGSIGQWLVQMATARGATVYATASTEEKRAVGRALGARDASRDAATEPAVEPAADEAWEATADGACEPAALPAAEVMREFKVEFWRLVLRDVLALPALEPAALL